MSQPAIHAIPTNLITGFLGTGKTTAILHLLANKPEGETWAVLVNEFGEIGIDGALLKQQGALVREVPGGCMCCVAGLPMRVGLNMLLARKPDRLLIEPTGLGHPLEVLNILTSDEYSETVELQASVCLLDSRNLSSERHTSNDNFRDQLALSDIVVVNKLDLATDSERAAVAPFLDTLAGDPRQIIEAEHGQIDPSLLRNDWIDRRQGVKDAHQAARAQAPAVYLPLSLPAGEDYLFRSGMRDGHYCGGWLFSRETVFDAEKLMLFLYGVNALRIKGVMRTDKGILAINAESGMFTQTELETAADSRIEFISEHPLEWAEVQQGLLACRL